MIDTIIDAKKQKRSYHLITYHKLRFKWGLESSLMNNIIVFHK
jgi:hypothetical protein